MVMKLVYSSAPVDHKYREQLAKHLHALVQEGLLTEWHEQLIPPGAAAQQERRRAWRAADVILVLLSADYFLSPDYHDEELRAALERHRAGLVLVVPVLVRPCDWPSSLVGQLQALPRAGTFVTRSEQRDEAWLTIAQELRQLIVTRQARHTPLSAVQRTNRQRLLKGVRTIWIDGMLEQSLHHATWIDLHLQRQPHGLENSWRLMVQELDRGPRPLPPGTSILQVFDEADEELLILGEPGSGKTTLLLYLARTLLERAEADERRRIPVIFNLSSWAQQRLPLAQWLVEELKVRYQVPQKVGRVWVEANEIFPLLDGLDEMAEPARAACVQAISTYAQREQERIALIVSCRTEEYQALPSQLPLQYAVLLLPFTDEQVEVYLSSVSGPIDALRAVLREDHELFELARRPLMLSIFTQAYQGKDAVQLPETTRHDEYPRALFTQYVKQMLTRRTQLQQGTPAQFRRWLTYFATQMQQRQQTIFTVEELQPSWLPAQYHKRYRWSMVLAYALTFGLLFGPVFGVSFGIAYASIFHIFPRLAFGAFFGFMLGIIGGLIGGLVFGLVFRQHQVIQPAEIAAWSGAAARKGLLVGAGGGLAFGLVGGLVGWIVAGTTGGIVVGCVVECIMVTVGGLVGGAAPTQIPERVALAPNEGIWRSGRRGLFAVLCFLLLVGAGAGVIVALFGAFIENLLYGLIFGLIFGAVGGLIFGLFFGLVGGRTGLAAFLQHFVLRIFLWRLGLLPFKLVAFLDEASERLLLRKVGGSYMFVHRLLRDVLVAQRNES